MDKKQMTLKLLNSLFDSSRGSLEEDWHDNTYILADLIQLVDESLEIALRRLVIEETLDSMSNVYKIPRIICKHYMTLEFMDNVMDQVDEAIVREIEEFVASTDILKHQKE